MTESAIAANPRPVARTPVLTLVSDHVRDQRPALSRRECDVLALVAEGMSTREVARRMAYSERTIKNILQDLTSRLQLNNRTQAVAYAVRNGWI